MTEQFKSPLRISVVTDIHGGFDHKKVYGDVVGFKLGSWSMHLTRQFIEATLDYNPDFAINMGDNTIATKSSPLTEQGQIQLQNNIRGAFSRLSCPTYELLGNHCSDLSNRIDDPAFPQQIPSSVLDIKGYRAIFWNANVEFWRGGLPEDAGTDHKAWLEKTLGQSNAPSILFSHVPPWAYSDADEILDIIRNNGHVILTMSGHKHIETLKMIDDIPHFTQQALSERKAGTPFPWGAYSNLEIDEGKILIRRRNIMTPCSDNQDYTISRIFTPEKRLSISTPSCE